MAKIDLHKFERDLATRPVDGSSAPPRTIKAKNLDDNNKKLTVLQGDGNPPAYRVKYTPEGTILTDIQSLPDSAIAKQFTVCENGTPTDYWFVVWNDQPQLPPA